MTKKYREDPAHKLRRLKLECLELQRQLESTPQETEKPDVDEPSKIASSLQRRPRKKPDSQALLNELLKLKTGLDEDESRANHYSESHSLNRKKLEKRRIENQNLVESLDDGATKQKQGPAETRESPEELHPRSESPPLTNVSELDSRLDRLEKKIGVGIEEGNAVRPVNEPRCTILNSSIY